MFKWRSAIATLPAARAYLTFFAMCAFALALMAPQQWSLWRVAQAPEQARGVVTATHCRGKSSRVDFVFRVDGATYSSRWRSVNDLPCNRARLGQPVNVSYERGAPQNNFGFAPDNDDSDRAEKAFWRATKAMTGFLFGVPLMMLLWGKGVLLFAAWLRGRRTLAKT